MRRLPRPRRAARSMYHPPHPPALGPHARPAFCASVDNPDARTTLGASPSKPGRRPRRSSRGGDVASSFPRSRSREMRGSWAFRHLPPGEHRIEGTRRWRWRFPTRAGGRSATSVSDASSSMGTRRTTRRRCSGRGPMGWACTMTRPCSSRGGSDLALHDLQYTAAEFPARATFRSLQHRLRGGARRARRRAPALCCSTTTRGAPTSSSTPSSPACAGAPLPVSAAVEGTMLEVGAPAAGAI